MYFESNDMQSETREKMRGGDGKVERLSIIPQDDLPPKIRFTGVIMLKKGCSIGIHPHTGDEEIYYCMSGEGVLDDNGTTKIFKKGDCHICKDGQSHGISNQKEEILTIFEAIALNN
jgi:quercetin dioxygenase-like cupin family protein